MALAKPTQITVPFSSNGVKNTIPETATGSNLASMQEGFPVITMTDVDQGGMPPQGQDMNGILFDVTKAIQYQQAGGLFPYDATFAQAIDGYPLGALLTSADGSCLYQNTVSGNVSDPDNGGQGWSQILSSASIAGKQDKLTPVQMDAVNSGITSARVAIYDSYAAGKQDTLTFDNTPTNGSTNPVTSDGIYTALGTKQDTITVDAVPTSGSTNPVQSGGVYDALAEKVDIEDAGDAEVTATGSTTPRTLANRFADVVNVRDFGANGDGTNDDTSAIQAAVTAANGGAVYFPKGNYLVSSSFSPDVEIVGEGKLTRTGISTGDCVVDYNPVRECLYLIPSTYQRENLSTNYPRPRQDGFQYNSYNLVFSPGSALNDTSKTIRFNTVFGQGSGSAPIVWGSTDAFGTDSMIYAGYSSRNVAVGSETFAWSGAPNQQWLVTYQHDWWRKPADNPYVPGESGWNGAGLETLFPGIGSRIDAFSDYATSEDDFQNNVALGRDAGNHIVTGVDNVFVGYASASQMFSGDTNTAVGFNAMRNVVFGTNNTAVGGDAGRNNLDGEGNTFIGYASGRTVNAGTGGVVIGYFAADGSTSADGAIVIGKNAGKSIANLDGKLFIGTDSAIATVGGNLSTNSVGVNLAPANIRSQLHVRAGASGSSLSPNFIGALIEGNNDTFLTIESPNNKSVGIAFADPDSNYAGGINYSHSSNRLIFRGNGTNRVSIESDGILSPIGNNTQQLGRAAALWKELFAGNATINTSDERLKANIRDINDDVLDAWGDVNLKVFQFKEAIQGKGTNARIHAGVIAQQVKSAFESHGLDACRFGLLCYDEWEATEAEYETEKRLVSEAVFDEYGDEVTPAVYEEVRVEVHPAQPAGNRYSIRYAEALILEAAYQRRRADRIEARLAALEERMA